MTDQQELVNVFRFVPWLKAIAITGGPCSGKTTFLKMAIGMLKRHDIRVIVVPEIARELIAAGFHPISNWRSELSFQRLIFERILEREASYFRALSEFHEAIQTVFLCDRGLLDGSAYVGEDQFQNMLREYGLSMASVLDRYHGVISLATAADGAEAFYVMDDERFETPEQARALDRRTAAAWHKHQHLTVVDNSTPFSDKINRALRALNRTLNLPTAMEIEKKYRVEWFENKPLLGTTAFYAIEQIYLDRKDRPGIECRVRKKTTDGVSSYYYTEKTSTTMEGVRGEHEEDITLSRYEELIALYADPASQPIKKKRYKVQEGAHMFEFDVYEGRLTGLVVLEVEFISKEDMEKFVPPSPYICCYSLYDVTADKRYSNRALARDGLPPVG